MFASSVIVSFFIKLSVLVNQSATVKATKSVFSLIGKAITDSILGKVALFFIRAEEYKDSSVSYKIIDKIKRMCLSPFTLTAKLSKTSIIMKITGDSFFLKTERLLMIFVFVIFLIPHNMWNNMYGFIVAVLLSLLYMTGIARKRDFRENVNGIWLSFILFVVATAISVAVSAYISDSIRVFVFFVTAFLFCLLAYGTLTSFKRLKNFSMVIYWVIFITSILAIIQTKLGIAVDPALTDVTINRDMPGRAFATFGNPNNYAEFLLIFIPFAFAFALSCKNKEKRIMLIIGMLIPFVALLLTYSRSGWLGFIAIIFVFVFLYNRKFFPMLILFGFLMIPLLPHSISNRIMTIGNLQDSSNAYRLNIWSGTLYMLKHFWYRGTGLGPIAFKEVYPLYAVITARTAPHAHMLLLEVWAEMGIIGLFSFIYLIWKFVHCAITNVLKTENSKLKVYYIAAVSSMAGIFTIGLFEYIWFYPRVLFAFFIAMGIAMATFKLSKDDKI